jgi:uncharacterized membrane protein YdjX (TVP38/TMEM64 family)
MDSSIEYYSSKTKKEIRIIEILLTIIIITLAIIWLLNYNYLKNQISTSILSYGLGALFVITLIIEVVPNIINPIFGLLVALVSGFNFYLAMASCVLGFIMGGILGFWLGKRYGFKIVFAFTKKSTVEKILKIKNKYGNLFMFISAVSPFPDVPIIFGALLVKWKDFIIYSLIPRTIIVIVLGYLFKIGLTL